MGVYRWRRRQIAHRQSTHKQTLMNPINTHEATTQESCVLLRV